MSDSPADAYRRSDSPSDAYRRSDSPSDAHRLGHLFSVEISFFEILANFDVTFRVEGVEIMKIGEEYGRREFQVLFRYHVRCPVVFVVAEILAVKETPLFNDF